MMNKLSPHFIERTLFANNVSINRLMTSQTNSDLNIDKYVHKLSLKTCQNLYSGKESALKWYLRSGPKTGLDVDVEYVDTKSGDNAGHHKTLLALHGCPGGHMDYRGLVRHFGPNYRVIVPNFPDFSVTDRTNGFWHSAQEKAQFIRDMLRALDVHTIDCLLCHSSAIFPASHLWLKDNELNRDFDIKSLCLLSNPGPKWFTIKTQLMASLFVHLSRLQSIRQTLRPIWSKKWTKRVGIRNAIEEYDSLALLLCTYLLSETRTVPKRLKQLTEMQIPTLSVFSSKDRLFNEEIFYDLYKHLKTSDDSFDVYEEHQNILVQKANDSHWLKVVDIRSGGHYVFATHSALVHKYIEELLQKVQ